MAKRLSMTTADYVAIAISPALIMALVGSLVYFLIEVCYAGEYQARLNYVFALFVFAAVLIARIAIEMGSDRAAVFSLPLGLATFLVLARFVEHPSPLSNLINLALIAVIWWCAHKLTWDCTLIDDSEDASGEGLLQHIGTDHPVSQATKHEKPARSANEIIADGDDERGRTWRQRFAKRRDRPHVPGVWVLYFSLAALPLFGIGQGWIPAADAERRRYAFALLAVYVASSLALLVTTSFLSLRRYLRQRHIEMPSPMAATWLVTGAVLILVVMLLAALVPRPNAEYAISRVPWQAGSPVGLSSSRFGPSRDGVADDQQRASEQILDPEATESIPGNQGKTQDQPSAYQEKSGNDIESGQSRSSSEPNDLDAADSDASNSKTRASGETAGDSRQQVDQRQRDGLQQSQIAQESKAGPNEEPAPVGTDPERNTESFNPLEQLAHVPQQLRNLPQTPGGLASILKLVFYVSIALVILYLTWRNRSAIRDAIVDVLRQLRQFFAQLLGGRKADRQAPADQPVRSARLPSFAEYEDPFQSAGYRTMPPSELVRYTFEAFEAWAGDRGCRRTPNQTPYELVLMVTTAKTPLFDEAKRMVRLYNETAYASHVVIAPEAAATLRRLWQLLRTAPPPDRVSFTAAR
jgi:hypothetical protein